MERIGQVAVVIPVHNEEQLLPGALAAVRTAADALQAHRPDTAVSVLVALDSCTDGSAAVAAHLAAVNRACRTLRPNSGWPIRTPIPVFPRTGCCASWNWPTAARTLSWEQWNLTRKGQKASS